MVVRVRFTRLLVAAFTARRATVLSLGRNGHANGRDSRKTDSARKRETFSFIVKNAEKDGQPWGAEVSAKMDYRSPGDFHGIPGGFRLDLGSREK